MKVLNQVIAIEKGIKSRTHERVTTAHRTLQKAELFNGHSKKYQAIDANGEQFEDDNRKVQFQAESLLEEICSNLKERFDIEATKDSTNGVASADVVLEGAVLLKSVPATTLIFLEKQMQELRNDLEKAPVLDSAEDWELDPNSNLYRTKPIRSHRTKKVIKAIVKYDATPEHPAQTDLINEDVVVGHYETTKLSGALRSPRKVELLKRVDKLIDALKTAREQANMTPTVELAVGDSIFGYLLK